MGGEEYRTIYSGRLERHTKSKKYRIRTKFLLTLAFLGVFLTLFWGQVRATAPDKEFVEVTVQPGDTLWDIASQWNSENKDVRHLIFEIKKVNEMETVMIHPGQRIIIPVED